MQVAYLSSKMGQGGTALRKKPPPRARGAVMRIDGGVLRALLAGAVLILAAGLQAQAFPSQGQQSHGMNNPTGADTHSPTTPSPAMQEKQALGRNAERQRRLVADTEKLLTLANELKTDVDKSDKNILSIDVVKKAEEIEKLAKSVKERMRAS